MYYCTWSRVGPWTPVSRYLLNTEGARVEDGGERLNRLWERHDQAAITRGSAVHARR